MQFCKMLFKWNRNCHQIFIILFAQILSRYMGNSLGWVFITGPTYFCTWIEPVIVFGFQRSTMGVFLEGPNRAHIWIIRAVQE